MEPPNGMKNPKNFFQQYEHPPIMNKVKKWGKYFLTSLSDFVEANFTPNPSNSLDHSSNFSIDMGQRNSQFYSNHDESAENVISYHTIDNACAANISNDCVANISNGMRTDILNSLSKQVTFYVAPDNGYITDSPKNTKFDEESPQNLAPGGWIKKTRNQRRKEAKRAQTKLQQGRQKDTEKVFKSNFRETTKRLHDQKSKESNEVLNEHFRCNPGFKDENFDLCSNGENFELTISSPIYSGKISENGDTHFSTYTNATSNSDNLQSDNYIYDNQN